MEMDKIEKLNKIIDQQRRASQAYYARNFKINDDMTESQKAEVRAKQEARAQKYKARYEANKDYYKNKVKEYRARKQEQQNNQQTN